MARAILVTAFLLYLCLPSVGAQTPPSSAPGGESDKSFLLNTKKGDQVLGFSAGYVFTVRANREHPTVVTGIPLMARWDYVLTDVMGQDMVPGQVLIGGELMFIEYVKPITTYGIGLSPTIKYSLLPDRRWRPFVGAGAGIFWTDLGGEIPEKGGRFNFILQGGTGIDVFLTPRYALEVGFRYQHISNADTAEPNIGIDSLHTYLGASYVY